MNFSLLENQYIDWDKIHDEFTSDYMESTLSNEEIRVKYGMTHGEFKEYRDIVKSEHNITKRPFWKSRAGSNKYYYKVHSGFIIMKRINGTQIYFGYVPSIEVAKTVVELCIEQAWDITVCKEIVHNWREYVN